MKTSSLHGSIIIPTSRPEFFVTYLPSPDNKNPSALLADKDCATNGSGAAYNSASATCDGMGDVVDAYEVCWTAHKNISIVTFWSILYSTIAVVSIIGNTLIILVIYNNRTMHTVTNIFIANLSVADVIVGLFSIPFQFQAALLQRWDLPWVLCPIAPFVKELSVCVSVLTLVVISVDRFFAVLHPLRQKFSKQLALAIMSVVWLFGIVSSAPRAAFYRVEIVEDDSPARETIPTETMLSLEPFSFAPFPGLTQAVSANNFNRTKPVCQPKYPPLFNVDTGQIYSVYLIAIQYFLPLVAISYAYTRIILHVRQQQAPDAATDSRDHIRNRNKRKVIKMMIIVVALFSCCWLPLQTYLLLHDRFPQIDDYPCINMIFFSIDWLAMSNSCYNPFIYGLLNEKFKRGFARLFRRCCFCLTFRALGGLDDDGRGRSVRRGAGGSEYDRSVTAADFSRQRSVRDGHNNVAYHRSALGFTSEVDISPCSSPPVSSPSRQPDAVSSPLRERSIASTFCDTTSSATAMTAGGIRLNYFPYSSTAPTGDTVRVGSVDADDTTALYDCESVRHRMDSSVL